MNQRPKSDGGSLTAQRVGGQLSISACPVRDNLGVQPVLVVIGGLPATGKSTIAAALAADATTPYLRVDRIEQAIVACRPCTQSGRSATPWRTNSPLSSFGWAWTSSSSASIRLRSLATPGRAPLRPPVLPSWRWRSSARTRRSTGAGSRVEIRREGPGETDLGRGRRTGIPAME